MIAPKTDRQRADEAERDAIAAIRALTDAIESVRARPDCQHWIYGAQGSIDAALRAIGILRTYYDPEFGPTHEKPFTLPIVVSNLRTAERMVREMLEVFEEVTSREPD